MNFLKNYKAWLILTVVLAVAAGALSVWLVRSYVGTVRVAAVLSDIEGGAVMQAQSVTMVDCAKGNLYPDAVRDPKQVVGMVARGFIPRGTLLRMSMFMPPQMAGISGQLAALGKDYRAVAIQNTMSTTVAGAVQAGDRVDIYASPKDSDTHIKILSDVLVLQAGSVKTSEGQQQTQGLILAVHEKDLESIIDYLPGGKKESPLTVVLKPAQNQKTEKK